VQAGSHAASYHSPVHSTYDWVRQQAQLQEAVIQFSKAHDKPCHRGIGFALMRIWVTAYREVRPSAL